MPEEKKNPFIVAFNGAARFAAGLTLGIVTFAGAFARASVGAVVNGVKTIGGAVLASGVFVAHLFNFARVQSIKGFNAVIGRKPKNPADVNLTKEALENLTSYTGRRFSAMLSSFSKVFSGTKDEEYKDKIEKVLSKPDEQRLSLDDRENEKLLAEAKQEDKKRIADVIGSIPNTKQMLINAARLMMGMTPKQRQEASTKAADTSKKNKNHVR